MPLPQLTDRLRDAENESMAKIAELEKQLSQARKELETMRVRLGPWAGPGGSLRSQGQRSGASKADYLPRPGQRMGLSRDRPAGGH